MPGTVVTLDAWARNPLLDDLRQVDPVWLASAQRRSPAPTLFLSGDLPPFTASGIDPSVLLQAPYLARHALASTPTQSEALRLLEEVLEVRDPQEIALYLAYGASIASAGASAYAERMTRWAEEGMPQSSRDAVGDALTAAYTTRSVVASTPGPCEEERRLARMGVPLNKRPPIEEVERLSARRREGVSGA